MTYNAEDIQRIAADIADLDEHITKLTADRDALKQQLRDTLPGPDTYAAGALTVVISANRRFNEQRALTLIPENLIPVITYPKTTVDKDRLKALLPDVWEQAQDIHAERVSIR